MLAKRQRQAGIGMLGVIFIILLASFFFTLLFKLGPAYMSYWTVRSVMDGVAADAEVIQGGARGIADRLGRRMDVNSVDHVNVKDFQIARIDEGLYSVTLDYEQREHLFFNVDAVLTFSYRTEVKSR